MHRFPSGRPTPVGSVGFTLVLENVDIYSVQIIHLESTLLVYPTISTFNK